jgi:hypothetical protein
MRAPRKVSLATAARSGMTWLIVHCETEKATPRAVRHATNVCGHSAQMPIADAIARWGEDASLSDLPLVCSVCGGRNVDTRAMFTPGPGAPLGR